MGLAEQSDPRGNGAKETTPNTKIPCARLVDVLGSGKEPCLLVPCEMSLGRAVSCAGFLTGDPKEDVKSLGIRVQAIVRWFPIKIHSIDSTFSWPRKQALPPCQQDSKRTRSFVFKRNAGFQNPLRGRPKMCEECRKPLSMICELAQARTGTSPSYENLDFLKQSILKCDYPPTIFTMEPFDVSGPAPFELKMIQTRTDSPNVQRFHVLIGQRVIALPPKY